MGKTDRIRCRCALPLIPVLALCLWAPDATAQQAAPSLPEDAFVSVTNPLQSLSSTDPLLGSVPDKLDPNPIQLTLLDAIHRGFTHNLELYLTSQNNRLSEGARWTALSKLLPNVQGLLGETIEQLNLATLGLPVGAIPGLSPIAGPFSVFAVGGTLNESLTFKDYNNWKAARENIKAARYSYLATRDLVVLVVGASYLQAQTDAARVESVQAQVATAQALYQQAVDERRVGTAPGIDVLRAQVELAAQQQRLVVARNDYEKQLLTLGRVIGFAPGQKFVLADKMPAPAPLVLTFEQALAKAYDNRSDYKQALSLARSAELAKKAAEGEALPSIGVNGNYEVTGNHPSSSHGVFVAAGTVQVPVFQGGKVRGDVMQAEAQLQQARSQLQDLRSRIEYEIRTAFLDVNAAAEQLEVATNTLELARQEVAQSRDRFSAGVTNTVEVVQAQQAQASAEENYINGLFAHNFSKLTLARALGMAEKATEEFLGGK